MKTTEQTEAKLFTIGLILAFCCFLSALVTKVHLNFVFKPQYFKALPKAEQQKWWYKLIDVQQGYEYFHSPAGKILIVVTIGSALLGFGLMIISSTLSSRNAERRSDERVEQWLKDHPPEKGKRRH